MEHYNAFISYKHAPLDNRVAEAVHKGLEHFPIPGKIRKKTGIRRIDRIFRDKDELPITSDLSDTIANALAGSDYLIVICSSNTKESAWVPREIECFLQNHTKKEIFTVLADGEPVDVIPDVLKTDEREVVGADGSKQRVTIPVEPLSCDFRMSPGKAKRTELPRLAAGLIGCGYDELMNRRRAYRIRRLVAVFSLILVLMAAFCGYMASSRAKIRQNYLASLTNQSRYLAGESENLLEKEQRITALQLALAALPKDEEDPRPVTPEAQRALTRATLAYESNDGKNIHAAWNYRMPGILSDFHVSPNGERIAAVDDGNQVCLWDTKSHEQLLYLEDIASEVIGLRFAGDDALAVWTRDTLTCYDAGSGQERWSHRISEEAFLDADNFCISGDTFYIGTTGNKYCHFACTSGKPLEGALEIQGSEETEDFGIVESALSPEGDKIAFRGIAGWNSYGYGILDLATGKSRISDLMEETIRDIGWADNDTLLLAHSVVDMTGSMSFGDTKVVSTDHSTILCVSASDLSEKWSGDFTCNGVMLQSGFMPLGEDIGYFSGNVITVYDKKTGAVRYSNNVNDSIIDVSDVDGDNTPVYITEDGGYALPAPTADADAVYYTPYFTDTLRQAVIRGGVYVRQNFASEVIFYGVHVYDEQWTALGGEALLPEMSAGSLVGDAYLSILAAEEEEPVLFVYGIGDEAFSAKIKLPGDGIYSYKLLGEKDGRILLGYNNSEADSFDLVSVDPAKGDPAAEPYFTMATNFDAACTLQEGKLVCLSKNESYETVLCVREPGSDEKKEVTLPEEDSYVSKRPAYYAGADTVVLQSEKLLAVSLNGGKITEIEAPENWTGAVCFSDTAGDGVFAVTDGNTILLAQPNGKVRQTIPCSGKDPLGLTFDDGDLLVLYADGSLLRYDGKDGRFMQKGDVTVNYNYNGDVEFQKDPENGLLYVQMETRCDVMDTESGVEVISIDGCYGHPSGRDIFITAGSDEDGNKKAGYYKHYTTKELMEKAEEILGGAGLSEETKSRYGIG